MRTRAAASVAVQPATSDEDDTTTDSLKFNEPLSWRAGKPIATGDLLRRLQTFAKELADLAQGDINRQSLARYAPDLISTNLLSHKDKGVRAHAACCLVDIFRLCAPDAPFNSAQLKEAFNHFITRIVPALDDPSNPYHAQHCHVAQSLSEFKSIVLLIDLPSPNALVLQLFTSCFDILSSPRDDLGKNVAYWMTGMLATIIDEFESLPSEVIDIVLAQFLRSDPFAASGGVSISRQPSPAYIMAAAICNDCPNPMSKYVSQYFSSVIVDATSPPKHTSGKTRSRKRGSSPLSDSDGEQQQEPSEDDLKDLEKAHRLLRELWRACPEVLRNVIPQIEAELSAENINIRLMATQAIGDLAAGIGAAGPPSSATLDPSAYPQINLAVSSFEAQGSFAPGLKSTQSFSQSHVSAYRSFLSRKNDKSSIVRTAWVTGIGRILATSAGGLGLSLSEEEELVEFLTQMLVDTDEKVRLAAVQNFSLFTFKDIITRFGSSEDAFAAGSLFHNLADRVKDRKHAVRVEAMSFLGRLWGSGVGELSAGNEQVQVLLGPLPSKILDAVYVNDPSINALVDHVLFDFLLPMTYPSVRKEKPSTEKSTHDNTKPANGKPSEALSEFDADRLRTERLLVLVRDLDDRAKAVLFALLARPVQLSQVMATLLKRCEEYNGGVMDKDEIDIKQHLHRLIEYFSKLFPDPARVAEDLWKFAKMHDRRCYALIRFCMAPESDFRKVYKSFRELKKRLEDKTNNNSTLTETLTLLIYRIANTVYNRSHVHPIIDISQKDDKGLGNAANEILSEISRKNPAVFKVHAVELCRDLETHAPKSGSTNSTDILSSLKACANFAKKFPSEVPKDRKFLQAMMQYALIGSPPKAANYAVTIILASPERRTLHAKDLAKHCIDEFVYGDEHFLTRLATLGQLMLLAANDLEDSLDAIHDIAIQQVLENVRTESSNELEWDPEVDEECQAKILALRILVNRLRFYKGDEVAKEAAVPIYQLLNSLIQHKGEISKTSSTPLAHRSRLRLEAGIMHLKLCINRNYEPFLVSTAFDNLALLAQDPRYEVRDRFINKVKKYLGQDRISSRFYTIVFLLAFDPSQKLKSQTATWLRARATQNAKKKVHLLEPVFARFLSLLAHHPDFSSSPEDLEDFVQYIMFYLTTVATQNNLSLIYHIAQRIKAVQDAVYPTKSRNLYLLSDLAQAVIRQFEEIQGWSMQAFVGKAKLPPTLFEALGSHDAAQEIANEQFLPEEVMDRIEPLIRSSMRSTSSKKKRRFESEPGNAAKRRALAHRPLEPSRSNAPPSAKSKRILKTPKRQKSAPSVDSPLTERRTSSRKAAQRSYVETGDSEDDAELEEWDNEVEAEDEDGNIVEDGEEEVENGKEEAEPVRAKATAKGRQSKGKENSSSVKRGSRKKNDSSSDELSDAPDSEEED